jgi:hypothetical protein
VLQFVDVNMRITRSTFTGITGTPFTLVFNNSNVQIDNTNFESNSGGSLLLHCSSHLCLLVCCVKPAQALASLN